ncbi:hypothetical protein [Photorhabdus temperata]|nr:hypothetical protein [Photorhabdus temperata]
MNTIALIGIDLGKHSFQGNCAQFSEKFHCRLTGTLSSQLDSAICVYL